MTRSILPSKARESARKAKAAVHRHQRRCARQEIELELDDEDDDFASDATSTLASTECKSEIHSVVRERRWGDKVGPFVRWARARTKHLGSDVERYYAARSLLGRSNVVTDHALGHFIDIERAKNPFRLRLLPRSRGAETLRPWRSVARLETLLARAIQARHARVNEILLETGFVRGCKIGDPCWSPPDRKRRHDPSRCARRELARGARDAARLALEIWKRPTTELVAALERLFRAVPRERGGTGNL